MCSHWRDRWMSVWCYEWRVVLWLKQGGIYWKVHKDVAALISCGWEVDNCSISFLSYDSCFPLLTTFSSFSDFSILFHKG